MIGVNEVRRFIHSVRERGITAGLKRGATYLTIGTLHTYLNWKMHITGRRGTDFMTEDWDNLVLLDACRYDFFEQQNDIEGQLQSRISVGRNSMEFMRNTFSGKELHDTVYVTSNPQTPRLEDGIFHDVIQRPLVDGWDPERGTVPPEEVTKTALEAYERYPNKRLIVHYMQPHMPYIGETAERVYSREKPTGWQHPTKEAENDRWRIFQAVQRGEIDQEVLQTLYLETLDIVLDNVETLLQELDGKSVISSDHGEFLNEKPHPLWPVKMCGHGIGRRYPRCEKLCKVPWLVFPYDTRRAVVTEEPRREQESIDERTVEDRLQALGYV